MPGTILKQLNTTPQTDGTAQTTGNSGWSSLNTGAGNTAIHADNAKMGQPAGYRMTQAASNPNIAYLDLNSAVSTFAFRVPFKYSQTPSGGSTTIFRMYSDAGHITDLGAIGITQTNRLQFAETGAGGLSLTSPSGNPLSANTDYVMMGLIDVTTDALSIKVYPLGSGTAVFSVDGTLTANFAAASGVYTIRWSIGTATLAGGSLDTNSAFAIGSGDWLVRHDLVNSPPTVSISPTTQNLAISSTANLTATATDSDGTIASHAWTFDYPSSGAPSFTGGSTATPSFTTGASVGSLYVARDTVTDNGGATGEATAEVRVPTTTNATTLASYTPAGSGGAWTVAGGAGSEGAALGDGSGTTYVESPDITSTASERRWRIQPMTTRTGYRFTLLGVSLTTSETHASKVRIYQGNSLITERATSTLKRVSDNATTDLTTTPTDLYLDLTSGEVSAITDPGDLWLAVEAVL